MYIMSKANYESYLKAYFKKEKSLAKKGLQMYDAVLSKNEFEAVYTATRNDLKRMVEKGERKVIGNVTQTIVTEQTYEYSQKQGKALAKYAEATGQQLTQQQIRAGQIDWNALTDYQLELKNKGFSSSEISKIVGQEYFGSE